MKCKINYLVAIFQARVCSLWEAVGRSVLESFSCILNNLRCLDFEYFCILPLWYTPQLTMSWNCVFQNYSTPAHSAIYDILNLCISEFCHSRIFHNLLCLEFVYFCILPLSDTPQFTIYWAWVLHSPHYGVISNLYIFFNMKDICWWATLLHNTSLCKKKCVNVNVAPGKLTFSLKKNNAVGSWLFFCVQKTFFCSRLAYHVCGDLNCLHYQRGCFFYQCKTLIFQMCVLFSGEIPNHHFPLLPLK